MRLNVPTYPAVFQLGAWELWQLPRPKNGSPLWINFKLMNRSARKRRGRLRSYSLVWGVDARRLRRDRQNVSLHTREPELHEAVVRFLKAEYTPERTLALIGPEALEAERARLKEGAARAAAARAERDAEWERMMS